MVAIFARLRQSHEPPAGADEPDALLVARARADREAFASLYLRYLEEVGRFCEQFVEHGALDAIPHGCVVPSLVPPLDR